MKRALHLAGAFTLMATFGLVNTVHAASKLDNAANAVVTFVKILVVAIFGWKAAEMAMKERYSAAWGLGLAAALVGGFLFGGEAVFQWAWGIIRGIVDGV